MTTYYTVAGTTGDEDFQLLENGIPVSIQSYTVALILRDAKGAVVTTTGDVQNLDDGSPGNTGKVRVNLDALDLNADRSPYAARFKVTDLGGKIVYFPTQGPDQWVVGRGE